MDTLITTQPADTYVVSHWSRPATDRRGKVWSAESFVDLNDALDFFAEVERGERSGLNVGRLLAFKDGVQIGVIDTYACLRELASDRKADAAHLRISNQPGFRRRER